MTNGESGKEVRYVDIFMRSYLACSRDAWIFQKVIISELNQKNQEKMKKTFVVRCAETNTSIPYENYEKAKFAYDVLKEYNYTPTMEDKE